tara:strand:+ start:9540 stop:10283 length:744 start_codon:yes stop_codon:yes gene_type:complete
MSSNEMFEKFNKGDPASKALDHKFLNSLTGAISGLSRATIGDSRVNVGGNSYDPRKVPPVEVKLTKVLEFEESTATLGFKGDTGEVNVIKLEVIDAVFEETVGTQTLTELDASSNVIYAAAPPSFTAEVDDFVWVVKWSHQWWVITGSGGGGASIVLFTITDADGCGSGCVDATVELRASGLTSVSIDDAITVYDEAGCFFNVDPVFLSGVKGFALKMEGDSPCTQYSTEDSHWVVISLCCALGGCP